MVKLRTILTSAEVPAPVSATDHARRKLHPTAAHIILDATSDVFRRLSPRVRDINELRLWIERRSHSSNPLVRGWWGSLIPPGSDRITRQSYTTCSCAGCEQPLQVPHLGYETREGEVYELTFRLFIECGRCGFCQWRAQVDLVEATLDEIDHAFSLGHRVWWGGLTYRPDRYDQAAGVAAAQYEDISAKEVSRVAQGLRDKLPAGQLPIWADLAQSERDTLVKAELVTELRKYRDRLRKEEWQGDDKTGCLRRRADEDASFRYLMAAEIAPGAGRASTLRSKGLEPGEFGPGKRMIHYHVLIVCSDKTITKRTLDRCWRKFGGGVSFFELLTENTKLAKVEYISKYIGKGPLGRPYSSSNWGLCLPRGTRGEAVQAARAQRLARRQEDRLDYVYLDAIKFDVEERQRRDEVATHRQDSLIAGSHDLSDEELSRVRALAQRLIDHSSDTVDGPFKLSAEAVEPTTVAPEVTDQDLRDAMSVAIAQPFHLPAKQVIRRFLGQRRKRRGRR